MRSGVYFFLTISLFLCAAPIQAADRFDVVIRGGRVVDGTGAPSIVTDVGITDGKIVRVGEIEKTAAAGRVIDAAGLIVAPGFIDMMGQTASPLLSNPTHAINLLAQGITTINCGEGVSAAPLGDEDAKRNPFRTMAEYFQILDMKGLPVNVVQTIGHTQARQLVLGDVDRRPSDAELEQMRAHVREAMEAGAIGLSTSLIYPPAVYASTEEITELAKIAGQHGGRYYTHMRNEGDRLLEAIDEALQIGRTAGTPVHIFHLKAAGRQNWEKMAQAIDRLRAARAAGQSVAADIYPYINNGLGIAALIHPRHFVSGEANLRGRLGDKELRAAIRKEMETETGWENWYRHIGMDWNKLIVGSIADENYKGLAGQSLAAIAKAKNEDPWDTFFNLVAASAFVLPESMDEANVVRAIQQDFVSFCTDVGPAGGSRIASHPRAFGALPRVFARFVREQKAITLEQAVAQASAVAAKEVMAVDRGRLAVGLAADVIVFDFDKFTDRATFAEPNRLAEGMKFVTVNGELVWDNGEQTKRRPGRVLRGPGYKPLRPTNLPDAQKTPPSLASLDQLFSAFMEKHRVPGCAVAVTDHGRLVYARGFGYADIAERKPVTPTSLFRIASISKPITAVAILQLVEQGKLKLDTPVFDILKYEPFLPKDATYDERQKQITIRHLLQHRGGWDRDKSFDAMFQSIRFADALGVPPPAGPVEIIRNMHGQKLDFVPGERYAYSNYGYCLLGRVIEKLTGETYEAYVQKHVLEPIGIHTMRLGKSRLEERHENEVRYYDPGTGNSVFASNRGQQVPLAYGSFNAEAMDSHGGWLASPIDLVRFGSAFDDPAKCALLKPDSIRTMFEKPAEQPAANAAAKILEPNAKPTDVFYALGWSVRPVGQQGHLTTWHTGSLPGTATILIRRHDGRNVAVVFNGRVSPHAPNLTKALEEPLNQTVEGITHWPEGNLFSNDR